MKKRILIAVFVLLLFSVATAESNGFLTHEEITISFTYGDRTGYYTGSTLNGVPHGYGCFETQNASGNTWIYIGEFDNGLFNGNGMQVWPENSESEQGIFEDGNMISGISRNSSIERIFEGEFTSDSRNTLVGKAYNADGTLFFEGTIVDGICQEGTIYNSDGSIAASGTFGEGFSKFIDEITSFNIFN